MKQQNLQYIQGKTTEKLFSTIAERKNYYVVQSTKEQDINDHIDVYLKKDNEELAIDIKSLKREHRSGGIQEDWHVIEFIAVTYPKYEIKNISKEIFDPANPNFNIGSGRKGWMYGKSTHIAFELKFVFVLVKRVDLINFCIKNVDFQKYTKNSAEAKYCLYSRINRGDLITYIHKNDLRHIAQDTWRKPIVINL